ncbi:hypothetical protein PRNP1_003830 [Phytophthora ramorum]
MAFNALGALVVAVAFNGVEYGGSFDFSLTFPQMMFILGCLCLPLGPAAWFLVHEDVVQPPKFSAYMSRFWGILQKRAVYQVAAYKFFSGVFNSFNIVSSSNIKLYWVHATPFNASIMAIVGTFVQWFWLTVPVIGDIPHAVRFIVNNYVVVELIEKGSEGALFGLLTTANHVSSPFGRTTAKFINARFHVWKDDILADTYETRRDVTITIWICYGMKMVSLAFLPLLPSQRAAIQALRRQGGVSKRMGMWMVGILMFALAWLTMVNVLSMNPATKCWKITGGCAPKSHHATL